MGGWLNVRGLRRGLGGTLRGGGYVGGGGVRWWGWGVCWMLDTLRGYVGEREYVGGGGGGGVVDVKNWCSFEFCREEKR